jgi:hypothetical protein
MVDQFYLSVAYKDCVYYITVAGRNVLIYTYKPELREKCRIPTIKELYQHRALLNSNKFYRDNIPIIDKLIDQIVKGMEW